MDQLASNPDTASSHRWWVVLMCTGALMLATVAAPEDFKTNQFGTQSILPAHILKLAKLLARGLAVALLSFHLVREFNNRRLWSSSSLMLPMFGFAVFGVVSVLWSAEKSTTLVQSATFMTLMLLAWQVATWWESERDTSRLIGFVSFLLAGISLGLVVLHFAMPEIGALTRRSSGIFHSTNAGSTASLGVVILFSSLVIWRWHWSRWLIVPGTLIHLGSMLIGANRLSMALVVLVCGLVFLFAAKAISLASTTLVITVLGIGYVCVDPGLIGCDELFERIGDFSSQGQTQNQLGNLSGRAEMWETIWASFRESPWIGHGYFVTSRTGRIFVWGEWGNWTAHNLILQVLVTTGIMGAAMLFVGIGNVAVRVILKIGSANKAHSRLALFLFVIGIWYLGWGVLNESFLGPLSPESVIFALCLGLGVALSTSANRRDTERASVDHLQTGTME